MVVLAGFFADPKLRARHVVAGQFLGIGAVFLICAAASFLSAFVALKYIGLAGFAPVVLGLFKLWELWRNKGDRPNASHAERNKNAVGKTLMVAGVTIANCSDDLGIWAPVLAVHSPGAIGLFGVVFAAMTAVWCVAAFWMVHHPQLGAPIRRYAHFVVPFVLLGLGFFVLDHAGSIQLIAGLL